MIRVRRRNADVGCALGRPVLLLYNFLMIIAVSLSSWLWFPLVCAREKRRSTFIHRVWMPPLERESMRSLPETAGSGSRIWIHALSVGEVLSAEPLVRELAAQGGGQHLIFTASTRTGVETAQRTIAPYVGAVRHFPFDTLFSVERAIRVIDPQRVIVVETDIWPNFLMLLQRRRIPVFLVNARLSDRSFKGYRRIGWLMAPLLSLFARICVQTEADRQRFAALGVPQSGLVTAGNIKFDQPAEKISPAMRERLQKTVNPQGRLPLWIAGSTHAGEEAMLAKAWRSLRDGGIDTVLIVVPRDPARAGDVCGEFNRMGIRTATLEQMENHPQAVSVVVIDRIGVLRQLYAVADVAFVGGSLVKAGGHNPLEPASLGVPVLFGPHTDDFRWICCTLEDAGGAVRIDDARQLVEAVDRLMSDPEERHRTGRRAQAVFRDHQGAVRRTIDLIDDTVVWASP